MQPIKIPQFMPNGKWQVDGILGADFWYGICHSVVSDYCLVYGAGRNLRPPEFQRLPSPGIAERAKGSGRQNIYIVHSREPADNPNEEPIEREMDCLWMKVAGKEGLFHIDLNLDGSYLYDDFFERVPKSARLRLGAHRFSYLPPISSAPSNERPEVLEWVARMDDSDADNWWRHREVELEQLQDNQGGLRLAGVIGRNQILACDWLYYYLGYCFKPFHNICDDTGHGVYLKLNEKKKPAVMKVAEVRGFAKAKRWWGPGYLP